MTILYAVLNFLLFLFYLGLFTSPIAIAAMIYGQAYDRKDYFWMVVVAVFWPFILVGIAALFAENGIRERLKERRDD